MAAVEPLFVADGASGFLFQASATDREGDPFVWSLAGLDAGFFAIDALGAVSIRAPLAWDARADENGDNRYRFTLGATDANGTTWQDIFVTIAPPAEVRAVTNIDAAESFVSDIVRFVPQQLYPHATFSLQGRFAGAVLDGATLKVTGLLPEDRLTVLHQGIGDGQIGLDGSTVTYGGLAIGTATGGVGAPFQVLLNGGATEAAVQALLRGLAFANDSEAPTASRTLTLALATSDGLALTRGGTPDFVAAGRLPGLVGYLPGDAAPAFVDLDEDGLQDLVVGTGEGWLQVLRNTGSGYVPFETNPLAGISTVAYAVPAFGDIDGDGRPDLVLGGSPFRLTAYRNTENGFVAFTTNPLAGISALGEYVTPAFADLNRDGRPDLVLGQDYGVFEAYENTGTGFVRMPDAPTRGYLDGVADRNAAAFADLDGDGLVDMVTGDNSAQVLAWRNAGSGFVRFDTNPFAGTNPFPDGVPWLVTRPTFTDLNGDGRLDLVVADSDGVVRTWINQTIAGEQVAVSVHTTHASDFAEGGTGVAYKASVIDPAVTGPVTWSLSGADAALFTVDADGAVRFRHAPDFETPRDQGRDNVHDVVVTASNGVASAAQTLAITVTDVAEAPRVTGIGSAITLTTRAGAGPQLLFPDASFAPSDALGGARLAVTGLLAGDRVTILHQGNAEGQIGFNGSTVTYGGVAIGTATGGTGTTFAVALTDAASVEATGALLRAIAFANEGDTPVASRRLNLNLMTEAGQDLNGPDAPQMQQFYVLDDPYQRGGTPNFSALGDINGDGRIDGISIDGSWRDVSDGGMRVSFGGRLNTGSGYSALPSSWFAGVEQNVPVGRAALADLDEDGRADLVIGDYGGG